MSSSEYTTENVTQTQKMQYLCDIQYEKQTASTNIGSNLFLFCKKLPFVMPIHAWHSFILSGKPEFCTLVSDTKKNSNTEDYWTII